MMWLHRLCGHTIAYAGRGWIYHRYECDCGKVWYR